MACPSHVVLVRTLCLQQSLGLNVELCNITPLPGSTALMQLVKLVADSAGTSAFLVGFPGLSESPRRQLPRLRSSFRTPFSQVLF